ncbi:MAG: hypothetical protein WCK04_06395, partial [Actinomycetes bacterium]
MVTTAWACGPRDTPLAHRKSPPTKFSKPYVHHPLIVPVMVGVEELASLDFVLWRRTGKQAARALGCNQSTISRRLGRCLEVFQLKMRRRRNEWDVPFSLLLQLERELHQHCRLLGHLP